MYLVGIAGGSGSGKTTFAKRILGEVDDPRVGLFHLDSYYVDEPVNQLRVHGEPNFDHPESFDWKLVGEHLEALQLGKSVQCPVYDYASGRRTDQTESLGPCDVILVEGIYTLWKAQIRSLFDLKIYLQVDADIRFIRRLHRDVRERSRSLDGIIRQYYDTVRPMHYEYLQPTRQYADIIIGEENELAAGVIAAKVGKIINS